MKNISSHIFLFEKKGLSNDDIGGARGTLFQETRPGAGFKTGDFVKEKWGGYRRTTRGYERTWGDLGLMGWSQRGRRRARPRQELRDTAMV